LLTNPDLTHTFANLLAHVMEMSTKVTKKRIKTPVQFELSVENLFQSDQHTVENVSDISTCRI
jgi:hypothetical protein